MSEHSVVIVAAKRTPIGAFQGVLTPLTAPQLGAAAIRAAVAAAGDRAGADSGSHHGLRAAGRPRPGTRSPGRHRRRPAVGTHATTINKMCGSGLKAIMLGADQIRAGDVEVVVAGGLESMTNSPYLLPKARGGYRMGNGEIIDHMFYDGLQSPFDGQLMGCFAERTSSRYQFSRAEQDAFAAESVRRSMRAIDAQDFEAELTPVTVKGRKGETVVSRDETPFNCDIAKIPTLKAAFAKDGTVTAASSSSIADGAAALVLMREAAARASGIKAPGAHSRLREPRSGA